MIHCGGNFTDERNTRRWDVRFKLAVPSAPRLATAHDRAALGSGVHGLGVDDILHRLPDMFEALRAGAPLLEVVVDPRLPHPQAAPVPAHSQGHPGALQSRDDSYEGVETLQTVRFLDNA